MCERKVDVATSKRLRISELNPHLLCALCGGYLIDATTIIECLHAFCKTCLLRYLETSNYCPICEVLIHKTRPWQNIRLDQTLQNAVYKMVPGLFQDEMKRRREFYDNLNRTDKKLLHSAQPLEEIGERIIFSHNEEFSISIEFSPDGNPVKENTLALQKRQKNVYIPEKRYLKCPAALRIEHLKKFIRLKFSLPTNIQIDLFIDKEPLIESYSLMDVAYIYMWKRDCVLRLFYSFYHIPTMVSVTEAVSVNDKVHKKSKEKREEKAQKRKAERKSKSKKEKSREKKQCKVTESPGPVVTAVSTGQTLSTPAGQKLKRKLAEPHPNDTDHQPAKMTKTAVNGLSVHFTSLPSKPKCPPEKTSYSIVQASKVKERCPSSKEKNKTKSCLKMLIKSSQVKPVDNSGHANKTGLMSSLPNLFDRIGTLSNMTQLNKSIPSSGNADKKSGGRKKSKVKDKKVLPKSSLVDQHDNISKDLCKNSEISLKSPAESSNCEVKEQTVAETKQCDSKVKQMSTSENSRQTSDCAAGKLNEKKDSTNNTLSQVNGGVIKEPIEGNTKTSKVISGHLTPDLEVQSDNKDIVLKIPLAEDSNSLKTKLPTESIINGGTTVAGEKNKILSVDKTKLEISEDKKMAINTDLKLSKIGSSIKMSGIDSNTTVLKLDIKKSEINGDKKLFVIHKDKNKPENGSKEDKVNFSEISPELKPEISSPEKCKTEINRTQDIPDTKPDSDKICQTLVNGKCAPTINTCKTDESDTDVKNNNDTSVVINMSKDKTPALVSTGDKDIPCSVKESHKSNDGSLRSLQEKSVAAQPSSNHDFTKHIIASTTSSSCSDTCVVSSSTTLPSFTAAKLVPRPASPLLPTDLSVSSVRAVVATPVVTVTSVTTISSVSAPTRSSAITNQHMSSPNWTGVSISKANNISRTLDKLSASSIAAFKKLKSPDLLSTRPSSVPPALVSNGLIHASGKCPTPTPLSTATSIDTFLIASTSAVTEPVHRASPTADSTITHLRIPKEAINVDNFLFDTKPSEKDSPKPNQPPSAQPHSPEQTAPSSKTAGEPSSVQERLVKTSEAQLTAVHQLPKTISQTSKSYTVARPSSSGRPNNNVIQTTKISTLIPKSTSITAKSTLYNKTFTYPASINSIPSHRSFLHTALPHGVPRPDLSNIINGTSVYDRTMVSKSSPIYSHSSVKPVCSPVSHPPATKPGVRDKESKQDKTKVKTVPPLTIPKTNLGSTTLKLQRSPGSTDHYIFAPAGPFGLSAHHNGEKSKVSKEKHSKTLTSPGISSLADRQRVPSIKISDINRNPIIVDSGVSEHLTSQYRSYNHSVTRAPAENSRGHSQGGSPTAGTDRSRDVRRPSDSELLISPHWHNYTTTDLLFNGFKLASHPKFQELHYDTDAMPLDYSQSSSKS